MLEAAAVFAAWLAVLSAVGPAPPGWPMLVGAAGHAFALAFFSVAVFYCSKLYDLPAAREFGRSVPRIALALAGAAVLLVAAHGAPAGCPIALAPLAGGLLAALGLVLTVRAGAYVCMDRRRHVERLLVVGGGPLANRLTALIEARPDSGQRVLGIVDDGYGAVPPYLRVGSLQDLRRILDELRPHRVIVALHCRRGRMPLTTLMDLRVRGIAVEDGVDTYERLTGKVAIEAVTPSSLIFCNDYRIFRMDRAMARALSLPAAALALALLAPLFGLVALAVKLDSPGPVFFVQPRVGRGGRLFRLIKFRTMRPASGSTSEWARDNDARLTRVGRRLRRFRLDELPQFVNILKGEMNLVGPRPHPVSNLPLLIVMTRNAPECGEQIPFYALRSLVRPGLTGWAQVRYRYANDLEEEMEKIRYDLYYVKHRSLWLDLRILAETVKVVLRGRESADPVQPAREPAGAARAAMAPVTRPGGPATAVRAGRPGRGTAAQA